MSPVSFAARAITACPGWQATARQLNAKTTTAGAGRPPEHRCSWLAEAAVLIIALDGKTARGARTKDGTAPHLLAAMICGARAVLAQRALVTADALHVQKETALAPLPLRSHAPRATKIQLALAESEPGRGAADCAIGLLYWCRLRNRQAE